MNGGRRVTCGEREGEIERVSSHVMSREERKLKKVLPPFKNNCKISLFRKFQINCNVNCSCVSHIFAIILERRMLRPIPKYGSVSTKKTKYFKGITE